MAVVAPFVGAWIEIVVACIFSNVASVAPLIEMRILWSTR